MKISEENSNKAVITTKYIMHYEKDITYVLYDEDGDWQFLSNEQVNEKDAMVVSVQQILERDASLTELPNIKKNQVMVRNSTGSNWVYQKK
ncbi:MAG TPA: hypothetical protein VFW07_04910 [Parafilimonas sp.]|nr:hypothetical protein [Parafilimonas sp.]